MIRVSTIIIIIAATSDLIHGKFEIMTITVPKNVPKNFDIKVGKCEDMFSNLKINFRDVGLQRIDSDFSNSPNVSCLNLEDNEIAYVSPTAFRQMPNLLYLNLARNKLSFGNFSHLNGHSHLRTLILDENLSETEDTLKFKNKFPRLLQLYLRGNHLKNIDSLDFVPNLMHLYLASNDLAEGNFSFLDNTPETLVSLDLADNGIRGFNVSQLMSLQNLQLDDNKIENICGKSECQNYDLILEGVTALRHLSLSGNQLMSIDSDAFVDTLNLEYLDLSSNNIGSIGQTTFEAIRNLRNLTLKQNLLTDIPVINGLESLEYLSLANNLVKLVGNDSFFGNDKLRIIDLSNNKINVIENGAFVKQVNLEVLDLSNNQLTTFPNTWMATLASLKVLHLDTNQLSNIDDLKIDSMGSNSKLKHVYLRNNYIDKFYTSSLLKSLTSIPNATIHFSYATQQISESNKSCECDYSETNDVSL